MGATFINPVESGGKLLRSFNQPIVSIDECKPAGAWNAPRQFTAVYEHIRTYSDR
jgi:hypothetical protein